MVERAAMDDLDLTPFGLMDIVEDPDAAVQPGLDVRLHGRFYRDPPEFVTVMAGVSAVVPCTTVTGRGQQGPSDDHDLWTTLRPQLTPESPALRPLVDEALHACAAGDPGRARTLGRDLHWVSRGDATLEELAHRLLVDGYRALGRPALADIADVHHRHRGLPTVNVLTDGTPAG